MSYLQNPGEHRWAKPVNPAYDVSGCFDLFLEEYRVKSKAKVATAHGVAYAKRLCRHFAHKLPVELGESELSVAFPFATCRIVADDTAMNMELDAADADGLERAEHVVADHLLRMANKDEPVVEWQRS